MPAAAEQPELQLVQYVYLTVKLGALGRYLDIMMFE